MRLKKKKKIKTRPESLEGGKEGGGRGRLNLSQADSEIYEPVSQHYNVTTSWTIINTANEHSSSTHGPHI